MALALRYGRLLRIRERVRRKFASGRPQVPAAAEAVLRGRRSHLRGRPRGPGPQRRQPLLHDARDSHRRHLRTRKPLLRKGRSRRSPFRSPARARVPRARRQGQGHRLRPSRARGQGLCPDRARRVQEGVDAGRRGQGRQGTRSCTPTPSSPARAWRSGGGDATTGSATATTSSSSPASAATASTVSRASGATRRTGSSSTREAAQEDFCLHLKECESGFDMHGQNTHGSMPKKPRTRPLNQSRPYHTNTHLPPHTRPGPGLPHATNHQTR